MAKTLPVRYVLTEPVAPTWWKKNRHLVLLVVGLVVGAWLVGGHHGPSRTSGPQPAHSAPAENGRSTR